MDRGDKEETGKLPLHLVPVEAIQAIARALEYGTKKYQPRNWEKGIPFSKLYAATLRHLLDWFDGQDFDHESSLHALDHALCDLAMLRTMTIRRQDLDDRPTAQTITYELNGNDREGNPITKTITYDRNRNEPMLYPPSQNIDQKVFWKDWGKGEKNKP